ncbi:hypothetical protein [Streptomyces sp. bgisy100]|uniref:hypothetical protein n=1 Tax=Streptomyces sp. bgisy100 TaxID=3413783 RepID=UPI003D74FD5B
MTCTYAWNEIVHGSLEGVRAEPAPRHDSREREQHRIHGDHLRLATTSVMIDTFQ